MHTADYGVEFFFGLVDEDEVGHVGDIAYHALAKLCEHSLLEGYEHAVCHLGHLLELLVGGVLGVWACQVAQHVPTVVHDQFIISFSRG